LLQGEDNMASKNTETVKVMVRCRPMNSKEKSERNKKIIEIDKKLNQIYVHRPDSAGVAKTFAFDQVYDDDSEQQSVYNDVAFPLVENVLEGYNATIFAYGQTGCGKTYTMSGVDEEGKRGIIPNTFHHIFGVIDTQSGKNKRFLARCSYLEIYNEKIHDLNGRDPKKKLELHEAKDKGVFVKDLNLHVVKSIDEIQEFMKNGERNKSMGETAMNKDSSRSHSIFTIYVETQETNEKGEIFKGGKLNLVDLAGSERQKKTGAIGDRLEEAKSINLSLSALGNVISALVNGKHVPYRDSKLTRLLQDSLGGNTKTAMVAAISPADSNFDETMSTLRYADRAKNIKNQPKINMDPKDALLKEYAEEITRLKKMLENKNLGRVPTGLQSDSEESEEEEDEFDASASGLTERTPHRRKSKKKRSTLRRKELEIREREKNLASQQGEQKKLRNLMQQLEEKLVVKGQVMEDKKLQETQKYRELQLKLDKEKQKERELLEQKRKQEEARLQKEEHYQNAQEELDVITAKIDKLRSQYKENKLEIKDLERDNELGREDLLENIREMEKDLKFYRRVVTIMLSKGEVKQLKKAYDWDDDGQCWTTVPFAFKQKQIRLPQLQKADSDSEDEILEPKKKGKANGVASSSGKSRSVSALKKNLPNGKSTRKASEDQEPMDTYDSYVEDDYSSSGSPMITVYNDDPMRDTMTDFARKPLASRGKNGFHPNGNGFNHHANGYGNANGNGGDPYESYTNQWPKDDRPITSGKGRRIQAKPINKNVQLAPMNNDGLSRLQSMKMNGIEEDHGPKLPEKAEKKTLKPLSNRPHTMSFNGDEMNGTTGGIRNSQDTRHHKESKSRRPHRLEKIDENLTATHTYTLGYNKVPNRG